MASSGMAASSHDIHGMSVQCILDRAPAEGCQSGSAESQVLRQSGLARLLVLRVHVSRGVGQRLDSCIEIHPMPACDLVGGDHGSCPGLYGTEGTALDAGHLNIPSDRVAGHAKMMLK